MAKNSIDTHFPMHSRKEKKENARREGAERNKAWREKTYKKQMETLQLDGHWSRTADTLTKQGAHIVLMAEKCGWDARPIDCENLKDAPKIPKEKKIKATLVEEMTTPEPIIVEE